MSGDNFYAALRVTLSLIGAIAWAIILVLSIPAVKNATVITRRLRMVTVVFLLALLSGLLALTAIYDWDRPAPADPFLAVIGVAIRAVLAIGGVVIIWTWPRDGSE